MVDVTHPRHSEITSLVLLVLYFTATVLVPPFHHNFSLTTFTLEAVWNSTIIMVIWHYLLLTHGHSLIAYIELWKHFVAQFSNFWVLIKHGVNLAFAYIYVAYNSQQTITVS